MTIKEIITNLKINTTTISILIIAVVLILIIIKYSEYVEYKLSRYKENGGTKYINLLTDKGMQGEYKVYKSLIRLKGKVRVLTNLYIPTDNGTTEIDALVITEQGLYVIESKNFTGLVIGNQQYNTWIKKSLYSGEFNFYNPINQNNGHIRALRKLGISELYGISITSCIVFGNKCKLRIKLKDGGGADFILCKLKKLTKEIDKSRSGYYSTTLSKSDIKKIYNELRKYIKATKRTKRKHIKRVERLGKY